MSSLTKNAYSRIKHSERLLSADLLWSGCSARSIDKKFGRSPFAISMEVKRNNKPQVYDADHAEELLCTEVNRHGGENVGNGGQEGQ